MADVRRPTRRQRFVRSGAARIRLTDDDVTAIHHLARHRFLRSTHLLKLLPHRPPKKLIERLGALYHAGYIDRPRAQIDYYLNHGSARMVYAIGNGSSIVMPELSKLDWIKKNRAATPGFLKHELLLADVMVTIEVAALARRDLQFISSEELRSQMPENAIPALSAISAPRRASGPTSTTT